MPVMQDDVGEADGARILMTGRVKWFDPGKGFGFILPDQGGSDVLLHANVLRAYGQSTVSDGSLIRFAAHETARGMQAIEVLEIVPQALAPSPELQELIDVDPAVLADLRLLPARVKWFDRARGFGFANVFGQDDDVFLHIEVLRRSGFAEVQPGEAICLHVVSGKRGRMAVLAAPWEAAVRADEA